MFHVKRVRPGSGDRVAQRELRVSSAEASAVDLRRGFDTALARLLNHRGASGVSIRRWRAYSTTGAMFHVKRSGSAAGGGEGQRDRAVERAAPSRPGGVLSRGFDTALARLLNHRDRDGGFDTALARLLDQRACAGFDTALARLLNHRGDGRAGKGGGGGRD